MYIPAAFEMTEPTVLHEFIDQHGFATLVSWQNGEPFASHLPLLLDRTQGKQGRLIGHMARANQQWKSAAGTKSMAIFHGPHSYISPSWYQAKEVVPTWNYLAVHVYGTLNLVEDPAIVRKHVQSLVERYESSRNPAWSMESPSPEFTNKLLFAIVAFEIEVDRIEGKWKLSQNHPQERREKVIAALSGEGEIELARLMAEI